MRRVVLLAGLGLLLAGTVSSQGGSGSAVVTFYGHVFSHGWTAPVPANTEFPLGEDNYGIGFLQTCPQDCTWTTNQNVLVLFSSAGFVDVEGPSQFAQEGGYSLLHNERGLTKDIVFDTSQSVRAGIWFTLDAHGWPVQTANPEGTNCAYPHPPDVPCLYPYWGWDPGIFPDVVVEATFGMAVMGEHGANASDAPPVLASVTAEKHTIIARGKIGPQQVINGLPGYENVYEYVIDLGAPQVERMPRENTMFLVFDPHQDTSGTQYELGRVRFFGGEFFAPWFTLPVKNPIDVERVVPTWAHGKLAILGIMNTPWGSYDVRDATLTIQGPNGRVTPKSMLEFDKSSVAHGGHYIPVNKTWVWDANADRAPEGKYTITVEAANWQGSARASCAAELTLVRRADGLLEATAIRPGVCGQQSEATAGLEERLRQEVD